MKPYHPRAFLALKAEIEAHRRSCGYYLIKLVGIEDLREAGKEQEEIAEEVFQYFDDHPWPPIEQRPQDQTWADYLTDREDARELAVYVLVGGSAVGRVGDTIPRSKAEQFFLRFESLFDEQRNYYRGMGFGDHSYVFLDGIAIISRSLAGVLWVVESD